MDLTIIQKIAVWAIPVIFAITLHEVAHGWVASWFGDQTARLSGRLSLNPIRHIDPVGTVILPLLMLAYSNFIFGWAKPVPVDPRNLHHPRRDMALVALAGPLSNIFMAFFWGAIAKTGIMLELSGSTWFGTPLVQMGAAGILINAVLAALNILPLPPLDGSKILASLLPRRMAYRFSLIEPYGFFILLFIFIFPPLRAIFNSIMLPLVFLLVNVISMLFKIDGFTLLNSLM